MRSPAPREPASLRFSTSRMRTLAENSSPSAMVHSASVAPAACARFTTSCASSRSSIYTQATIGGDAVGSLVPRIDDSNPAMLEVLRIAGCDRGILRAGDGGNHGIGLRGRTAQGLSSRHYLCVHTRGFFVKRADSSGEQLCEHPLGASSQIRPALTGWQHLDSIEHFRLRNGGGGNGLRFLSIHPANDLLCGRRPESFRHNVGIEHNHYVKSGGRRASSRGGNSSSTPPSGSNISRIAVPKPFGAASVESPNLRISRASSCIDRPCCAARTRSLVLSPSSRRRIVMLAID